MDVCQGKHFIQKICKFIIVSLKPENKMESSLLKSWKLELIFTSFTITNNYMRINTSSSCSVGCADKDMTLKLVARMSQIINCVQLRRSQTRQSA